MGKMIFTVLGAVAELERNLIKERVHMGISRARKQGKSLGRPKRIFDRDRARTMLQTMSAREVAPQLESAGVLLSAYYRSGAYQRSLRHPLKPKRIGAESPQFFKLAQTSVDEEIVGCWVSLYCLS
jgi:DNA invertase Pin-like site-specific DNA recombinase